MRHLPFLLILACAEPEPEDPGPEPAKLVIDTPAGGSWVAPGQVRVSGTAHGMTDVTLNGAPVTLDAERFSTTIDVPVGVTAFEVRGLDARGDEVYERRSVIGGEFGSSEELVDKAIALRLSEEGIDEVVGAVSSLVDINALTATATSSNPVVTGTYGPFDYSIDLLELSLLPPILHADPRDGVLGLTVTLDNIDTAVQLTGGLLGFDLDTSASAHIDQVTATLDLRLAAVGGGLDVELGPVDINVVGFSFDASLIPGTFEDQIPILSDALLDFLVGTVEEQIRLLAPGIVDSLEDQLLLSFTTTVLETTATADAQINKILVEDDGVRLDLDLGVTLVGAGGDVRYAGVLTLPPAPHRPPENGDVGASLHDDLLNRILFEAWKAGLLNLTFTTEDLPLLSVMLDQLGATTGSIGVQAHLPPVAIEKDGQLSVQIGELDLRVETPGGEFGNYVVIRLAGKVPIDPKIDGGSLGVTVGDPDLSMMVVDTDWRASKSTITTLLESQLPIDALLSLASAFSFDIPPFFGLQIDNATADRDATGVHTTISMDLGAAPAVAP